MRKYTNLNSTDLDIDMEDYKSMFLVSNLSYLFSNGRDTLYKHYKFEIVKDFDDISDLNEKWFEENIQGDYEIYIWQIYISFADEILNKLVYIFYFNSDEDYFKFILTWGYGEEAYGQETPRDYDF